MCTPSLALGAVSGVANYAAANQQAKYAESLAIQQADAARDAYAYDTAQLGLQEQQRSAAASREATQVGREVAKAEAAAITSAGEAGQAGLSLDALLADYYRQGATEKETIRYNEGIAAKQTQAEREKLQATTTSRINTAFSGVPSRPNLGLSIASGMLGGL